MAIAEIAVLAVVFLCAIGAALFGMRLVPNTAVRERLERMTANGRAATEAEADWSDRLADAVAPAGKLLLPKEGTEDVTLRQRFLHAGFRSRKAPLAFFGAKALLGAGLPLLFLLAAGVSRIDFSLNAVLVTTVGSAAFGYFAPNMLLAIAIDRRQEELVLHLPEAVDLLIVALEAGLGLDAAIARIAPEMAARSPALDEELRTVILELRAGASRPMALRNLASRTGLAELNTLTAMLVQADRFGTALGQALRQYAESLRTTRRLRAEEAAAKVGLQMLFPLILCIFPSIMIVLMGPAVIRIYRMFVPISG